MNSVLASTLSACHVDVNLFLKGYVLLAVSNTDPVGKDPVPPVFVLRTISPAASGEAWTAKQPHHRR